MLWKEALPSLDFSIYQARPDSLIALHPKNLLKKENELEEQLCELEEGKD